MKNKRGQLWLIGVFVLLVLGVGGYFLVKNITGNAVTGDVVSGDTNVITGEATSSPTPAPSTPVPETPVSSGGGGGGGGGSSGSGYSSPVLALIGDNPQIIELNSPYVELGATASDSAWGDLTSSIVIDNSSVNTASIGFYTVTYTVTNGYGNSVADTRTVKVIDKQVIIKAADRLVALQNSNGGWDWIVTNNIAFVGDTSLNCGLNGCFNIAGVTAEGLLDTYKLTGETKYLDAAKKAGDYIVATPISTTQRQNAFSVAFLYHLYDVTTNIGYKDKADAIMNHLLHEENYWTVSPHDFDVDGTVGLSAQELLEAYKSYRGANLTYTPGIVAWDLMNFAEVGNRFGDASFAQDIANEIKSYLDQSTYTETTDDYELGLGAGIRVLKLEGMDYTPYLTKLLAKQQSDGSFASPNYPDEHIQSTAYASMVLISVNNENAFKALEYIRSKFGYSPFDGWLENGVEYSEVDSEAIQALYSYIE